jgi:methenyltetrahydrofolate cyclohydrolase
MKLTDTTVTTLLEAFRSSAPTPGGGSASALAGAIGASLLAMVAGLPKPRAASDVDLRKLEAAGNRCTAWAKDLEALVDKDSEAYDLVVSAYRLPKATDQEKAARSARIQDALRTAIEAPLDVMRTCARAIAEGPLLLDVGNPNASSDIKVGLELLRGGLRGAHLNVLINLESVSDREYALRVGTEARRLVNESGAAAAPSGSS